MAYVPPTKIQKTRPNEGAGGQISDEITVIKMIEVANLPIDCQGSVLKTGAVIMKATKYPTVLAVLAKSIKVNCKSVGNSEDGNAAFENMLEVDFPGFEI